MRNGLKKLSVGVALGITVACSGQSMANAPGYTYELIYSNDQFNVNEKLDVGYTAISPAGHIVFATRQVFGFSGSTYRVYAMPRGETPRLIFEAPFDAPEDAPWLADVPIGVNADGVVSIGVFQPVSDGAGGFINEPRRLLFSIDGVLISEIFLNGFRVSTGGTVSFAGEIGLIDERRGQCSSVDLVITDGLTSRRTNLGFIPFIDGACRPPYQGVTSGGEVAVNAGGAAALRVNQGDRLRNLALAWADPPGALSQVVFGDRNGAGYSPTVRVPGFNDLGWMSFATHSDDFGINPNGRVMLISPQGGVFNVATMAGSNFVNFRQARQHNAAGVSLNNFNRISFIAELESGEEGIWVGDASGDPPSRVYTENITFEDGRQLQTQRFANDVTSHGANSMSDLGEVLVGASGTSLASDGSVIRSSDSVLMLATPDVGLEPGRPVLPDRVEVDGSFRLRRGCRGFGRRCFYDPPVAVGYGYDIDENDVGAFESVLIPAPLPGGDEDFVLEANGVAVPLQAGVALEFAAISPDPVRSFAITDISVDEALDPEDVTAFVTGLTFIEGSDEDLEFLMTPITINTTDADGDGVDDGIDNCPADPNPEQSDADGDGIGDVCDPLTDSDADGVADAVDNCAATPNTGQEDTDGDGIGDVCDPLTDSDGDGVDDAVDNCPATANPGQEDSDGDGLGDACDIEEPTRDAPPITFGSHRLSGTFNIGEITHTVSVLFDQVRYGNGTGHKAYFKPADYTVQTVPPLSSAFGTVRCPSLEGPTLKGFGGRKPTATCFWGTSDTPEEGRTFELNEFRSNGPGAQPQFNEIRPDAVTLAGDITDPQNGEVYTVRLTGDLVEYRGATGHRAFIKAEYAGHRIDKSELKGTRIKIRSCTFGMHTHQVDLVAGQPIAVTCEWKKGNGRQPPENFGSVILEPTVAITEDEPAPRISGFRVLSVANNRVRLAWETDIPATSQVFFRLRNRTDLEYTTGVDDPVLKTLHEVVLPTPLGTGLTANTAYEMFARSVNASGVGADSNLVAVRTRR